jgi:hypothetical protein
MAGIVKSASIILRMPDKTANRPNSGTTKSGFVRHPQENCNVLTKATLRRTEFIPFAGNRQGNGIDFLLFAKDFPAGADIRQ